MKIKLNKWQIRDIMEALDDAIEGDEEVLKHFGSSRGWKVKTRDLKVKIERLKKLRKYLKYIYYRNHLFTVVLYNIIQILSDKIF